MSLKAIKEAVEYFEENHCSTDCQSGEAADRASERIGKALSEISVLEGACRTLAVNGVLARIEERATKSEREAVAVLKAIAKEAK